MKKAPIICQIHYSKENPIIENLDYNPITNETIDQEYLLIKDSKIVADKKMVQNQILKKRSMERIPLLENLDDYLIHEDTLI